MTKDKSDQGKPTCCGPGDLSACAIEITEAKNKTEAKAKSPTTSSEIAETENGGKA